WGICCAGSVLVNAQMRATKAARRKRIALLQCLFVATAQQLGIRKASQQCRRKQANAPQPISTTQTAIQSNVVTRFNGEFDGGTQVATWFRLPSHTAMGCRT